MANHDGFKRVQISKELKEHFSADWCQDLLNDSGYIPIEWYARVPKESTEDSMIAVTLRTKDTIAQTIPLYKPSGDKSSGSSSELLLLLDIGEGLNGHPKIMHGGAIATILDEVIGFCVGVVQTRSTFTAYLNMTYKKPVPTPGPLLARATLKKQEGRKLFVDATLEDGKGTVYATAESLYLEVRSKI